MIKYHTITIDDYLVPEGSDLPDSIEVEIWANCDWQSPEPEVGFEGGWNVGGISYRGTMTAQEWRIVADYISKHEDRLKEILANK